MRGATRRQDLARHPSFISIHAPHARSDSSRVPLLHPFRHFNPRSSCEERPLRVFGVIATTKFQSTLLMRGATAMAIPSIFRCSYFNPRSSCEERLIIARVDKTDKQFQSTLLMRGATKILFRGMDDSIFQSTLLMRGATRAAEPPLGLLYISIHAPHARSDSQEKNINLYYMVFQSTLLMRGATPLLWLSRRDGNFNPRSSCEERPYRPRTRRGPLYFNPRSSCEERL